MWSVLTGKEYNRMARKRMTMMSRMRTMKRHLNFLHTMNFMVLHGLVNQKKDVSGRLVMTENGGNVDTYQRSILNDEQEHL